MGSCDVYLNNCDIIDFSGYRLMSIIKILLFFYFYSLSETFASCIDKGSAFIVGVPGIDKVTWIIEAD